MKRTSFWTYFTSAYGTCWLALLAFGFIAQDHIDAGIFGLIGFPLISLFYAGIRRSSDRDDIEDATREVPVSDLHPRIGEFIKAYPEFIHAATHVRNHAFERWLRNQESHQSDAGERPI